jgi:hypothetical protein
MSNRQPTIILDNEVIAHDEIAEIIDLNDFFTLAGKEKEPAAKAIRLVNGTIVPLTAQKIDGVIGFLCENEN